MNDSCTCKCKTTEPLKVIDWTKPLRLTIPGGSEGVPVRYVGSINSDYPHIVTLPNLYDNTERVYFSKETGDTWGRDHADKWRHIGAISNIRAKPRELLLTRTKVLGNTSAAALWTQSFYSIENNKAERNPNCEYMVVREVLDNE